MKKHTLKAEIRDVSGRRVKNLRKEGKLPATIYGKNFKSQSLSLEAERFGELLKTAGTSGLIDLSVGNEVQPVIIGSVQMDPIHNVPLHVEFRRVDLKEKIRTGVPFKITGVSPVVESGEGLLLQAIDELEVEALPGNLPENIIIDISQLLAVDTEITVGQLKLPAGVTALTPGDQAVVRITPPVKEEEPVAAPAAAEAAVEPADGGEKPPVGEKASSPEPVKE